ncbi:MAG: PP2C family protein-serine/threonine phosphatase [Candidatus Xenobia bacterium]
MRIATKIVLALAVMVALIVAGSLYTYFSTSGLTAIVSRVLDQELPEIDKLDRLQDLITTTHALQTQILSDSDPSKHPQFLIAFERNSKAAGDAVDNLRSLVYVGPSTPIVGQIKQQVPDLINLEEQAVQLADTDEFTARQYSTQALGLRLQVMDRIARLQAIYRNYLIEHERANLNTGMELRKVSIGFAAVSALVAFLLVVGGIRTVLVPLMALVRVTDKIAGGQLQEVADESRADEFGHLARSFNQMVQALRSRLDEVAEKNRNLQAAEQTLARQLRLAQQVQKSIVPRHPSLPGLDVFGRIHAAQRIGGDFYDVQTLDQEGTRIGLMIGDASGSGIPAALVMVMALTVSREAARQTRNPAEIFDLVNRRIREQFPDEMLDAFITASYVAVDLTAGTVCWSNAGHEPPFLWRPAGKELTRLEGRGMFLAAFDEARFEVAEMRVEPGDKILLCTDGLFETRDPDGNFFGLARIEACLRTHGHLSSQDLGEKILSAATDFRGDPVPRDDVALVIAEIKGADHS